MIAQYNGISLELTKGESFEDTFNETNQFIRFFLDTQYKPGVPNEYKEFADKISVKFFNDLEAANDAIDKGTMGIFKNLLGENIESAIVAACGFKGKFCEPFDKDKTKQMPFSTGKSVDFMNNTGVFRYIKKTNGDMAVVIPYKSGEKLLVIGNEHGDVNFEDHAYLIPKVIKSGEYGTIYLSIPKYKINTVGPVKSDLVETCLEMGLNDLAQKVNDFDEVIHAGFIETDEEGTTAAGVIYSRGFTVADIPPALTFNHKHYAVVINEQNEPMFAAHITF